MTTSKIGRHDGIGARDDRWCGKRLVAPIAMILASACVIASVSLAASPSCAAEPPASHESRERWADSPTGYLYVDTARISLAERLAYVATKAPGRRHLYEVAHRFSDDFHIGGKRYVQTGKRGIHPVYVAVMSDHVEIGLWYKTFNAALAEEVRRLASDPSVVRVVPSYEVQLEGEMYAGERITGSSGAACSDAFTVRSTAYGTWFKVSAAHCADQLPPPLQHGGGDYNPAPHAHDMSWSSSCAACPGHSNVEASLLYIGTSSGCGAPPPAASPSVRIGNGSPPPTLTIRDEGNPAVFDVPGSSYVCHFGQGMLDEYGNGLKCGTLQSDDAEVDDGGHHFTFMRLAYNAEGLSRVGDSGSAWWGSYYPSTDVSAVGVHLGGLCTFGTSCVIGPKGTQIRQWSVYSWWPNVQEWLGSSMVMHR